MVKRRKTCFTVYSVPKQGKPQKIVSGVSRLEARRIVKRIPTTKSSFAGFTKCGKKVTNKSSFSF